MLLLRRTFHQKTCWRVPFTVGRHLWLRLGSNRPARIHVPIASSDSADSYYGDLGLPQQAVLSPGLYDAGHRQYHCLWSTYLRSLDEQATLLIIWDGASYHRFANLLVRIYWGEHRLIYRSGTLCVFLVCLHAPEQNCWYICHKAEQFIQKFFMLKSCSKYLFDMTHQQRFGEGIYVKGWLNIHLGIGIAIALGISNLREEC